MLSGNEGYSFGPHLHMEIRRTDTGELIDPLQFYTDKIKDTTPPRASMIMLYPQRGAGVVEGSQRKKSISVASLGQPVSAWGKIDGAQPLWPAEVWECQGGSFCSCFASIPEK